MDKLPIGDLFARRSVRQYTGEPVTEEQIELLLKAAMAAPTAANRKPWHYVVVTDAETKARLAEAHPFAKMLLQAPLCIIPCGEPAASVPARPEFWVQDLSASAENVLLAATGLGLGGVWCGVYPDAERQQVLRQVLGIPGDIEPFCLLVIGHPVEMPEPRTQYDATRVHHEQW
jgi:nitroreductase